MKQFRRPRHIDRSSALHVELVRGFTLDQPHLEAMGGLVLHWSKHVIVALYKIAVHLVIGSILKTKFKITI